jgi:hypothetical protein
MAAVTVQSFDLKLAGQLLSGPTWHPVPLRPANQRPALCDLSHHSHLPDACAPPHWAIALHCLAACSGRPSLISARARARVLPPGCCRVYRQLAAADAVKHVCPPRRHQAWPGPQGGVNLRAGRHATRWRRQAAPNAPAWSDLPAARPLSFPSVAGRLAQPTSAACTAGLPTSSKQTLLVGQSQRCSGTRVLDCARPVDRSRSAPGERLQFVQHKSGHPLQAAQAGDSVSPGG